MSKSNRRWTSKTILNSNEWEVRSAGIEAHGINPRAVKIMDEINIDISKINLKSLI